MKPGAVAGAKVLDPAAECDCRSILTQVAASPPN